MLMPVLKILFHLLEMEIKCFNTRHNPWILKDEDSQGLINLPLVQLENSRDFEELLKDLNRRTRRARLLRHQSDHILSDELVAVREGKGWQREIVIQLGKGDLVTITLRDWDRAIQ